MFAKSYKKINYMHGGGIENACMSLNIRFLLINYLKITKILQARHMCCLMHIYILQLIIGTFGH